MKCNFQNMKKIATVLLVLSICISCKKKEENSAASEKSKTDYTQFVNPFIGTSNCLLYTSDAADE